MKFISPNWNAPAHVKAVSTTRLGGLSKGIYKGFNLGLHVNDNPQLVLKNREKLRSELSLKNDINWLEQVHGVDIVEFDNLELTDSPPKIADGASTTKPHAVCAIMTADCLPLLLTNSDGSRVAAIHAGWRGIASGIVEKAVSLFDVTDNVIAWAGPCIGFDAFEIGLEVRDQLGGPSNAYKRTNNGDKQKILANLYSIVGERLSSVGVNNYTHSSACTFQDSELYYSYRRDGQCGRMASLIWIDPT